MHVPSRVPYSEGRNIFATCIIVILSRSLKIFVAVSAISVKKGTRKAIYRLIRTMGEFLAKRICNNVASRGVERRRKSWQQRAAPLFVTYKMAAGYHSRIFMSATWTANKGARTSSAIPIECACSTLRNLVQHAAAAIYFCKIQTKLIFKIRFCRDRFRALNSSRCRRIPYCISRYNTNSQCDLSDSFWYIYTLRADI